MKTKNFILIPRKYYDIYYGRENVAIKSIKELPGNDIGIKIVLYSPNNTVSHFLFSTGQNDFSKLKNNTITVKFIDNDQIQDAIYKIKPIFKDSKETEIYTINIKCYPSKFYASQKMTGHPHIIALCNDPILNIGTGSVDAWLVSPTEKEKKFALNKWGSLVENEKTDYEKAKILAKTLMHDLWPHSGFPSDAMNVPPFEQYKRMVSGKDKGYCSNFMAIFVHACNSLGIPARSCGINEIYFNRNNSEKCKKMNIQIQGGSCHGTTEIFDNGLNHWIWMDLRYYALGAWIGNIGPLTLAEFQIFINQKQRREKLKLLIYNMENKSEKLLPLNKCPKQEFDCFTGWDVKLNYQKIK
mgnify:FL=1